MSRRRSARQNVTNVEPVTARIESLSREGRGVARVDGKTVFIDNALPGEEVRFRYKKRHGRYDEGGTIEVIAASANRVEPKCAHFGVCGGCALQHMEPSAQLEHKQAMLVEQLQHLGGIDPVLLLPPVAGPIWGYRRRARLGVRHVAKKGGVLVGFRERDTNYLAEMSRCEVLDPRVGGLIGALRELLSGLSLCDRIPQIEVAVDDQIASLTIRHLAPFSDADLAALRDFAESRDIHIYLQPGGIDSIMPLWPPAPSPLSFRIPAHDVEIRFRPLDFVQVNAAINLSAIDRAIALLDAQATDQVLELFCGLGNFTLPVARRVGRIVGIEGDGALVERARDNAAHNGITNAEFIQADLSIADPLPGEFNKLLLDPPRTGAVEILRKLDLQRVQRLVYVSCNPATLARDAALLVGEKGMRLAGAGVMDMFPHTAHVESIAVFER